jgi:hypothetical protein
MRAGVCRHCSSLLLLLLLLALQVSLTIRLAVGVTEAQAAADTDSRLAAWLAQPRNIRNAITLSGVPDPIGPHALIKWLLTPEIWVSPVSAADAGFSLENVVHVGF